MSENQENQEKRELLINSLNNFSKLIREGNYTQKELLKEVKNIVELTKPKKEVK